MQARSVGRVLIASAGIALAFVACASSAMPPLDTSGYIPPEEHATGFDAGPEDAASDGSAACTNPPDGGCADLAICSARVYLSGFSTAPAAGVGGTIVPGVYNLIGYAGYAISSIPNGTSTTTWDRSVLRITAAGNTGDAGDDAGAGSDAGGTVVLNVDEATDDDSTAISTLSGTFTASGSSLGIVFPCGGSGTKTNVTYSANATQLVIYIPQSGGALVQTFLLQ